MKSMTGYARADGRIGDRICMVEIKTVNHRFLDVYIKAPKSFISLEQSMKKHLGTKITRGRVDAMIQMENNSDQKARVNLNLPLAREYTALLTQLKDELHFPEAVSLGYLISMPEVITVEKIDEDFKQWDELKTLLDKALDDLNTMREAEGEMLKKDLQERINNISRIVAEIELNAAQVTTVNREKLLKRFRDLDLPYEIDEGRLLTEVFFLAERTDITEEIVRTKSHLKQCQDLMFSQNVIGRRLDFTLQEINREINTMSSKAGDIKVSQAAVEIKSDLEKIREQVQNVE